MRVDGCEDVTSETVPVLVVESWRPSSVSHAEILSMLDGVSSVEEIAREAGARLSSVRALISRLAKLGAVELVEWADDEDIELIEEAVESTTRAVARACANRRTPAPTFVRLSDESPLVEAVLAHISRPPER